MTLVMTSAQAVSAPSCFGNFVIRKDKFGDLEGKVVAVGVGCLGGGAVQSLGVTRAGQTERSGGQLGVTHLLF